MVLGRRQFTGKVVENGVFDGEAGAHCYYIIVEFSSRPGGIGGDRQGRPKGQYEAAGRDYGYAEGGRTYTLLLLASIKFKTSISDVIFVQNSLVSCEI